MVVAQVKMKFVEFQSRHFIHEVEDGAGREESARYVQHHAPVGKSVKVGSRSGRFVTTIVMYIYIYVYVCVC